VLQLQLVSDGDENSPGPESIDSTLSMMDGNDDEGVGLYVEYERKH